MWEVQVFVIVAVQLMLCGAAAVGFGFEMMMMMMTNDVFVRFNSSPHTPSLHVSLYLLFPLQFKMFGQVNFPSHAVSQLISFLN